MLSRQLKAFTLIELLVVIAIISLLVSILLPSLNRAKELAKRVVCASNQRNVVMAYNLYANEYNGDIPIGYWGGIKQANYMIATSDGTLFIFGYLYGANLMSEPRVFDCPSCPIFDLGWNPWPPGSDPPNVTRAGLAARPEADWPSAQPPQVFPSLFDLDQKAIVADWHSCGSHLDYRHEDGVNVGYGDGSAHWVDRSLFDEDLSLILSNWSIPYNVNIENIWDIFDEQH